jgi:hypothetical protein
LKYGRAGKRHNTSKKSKTVQRRLNLKVKFLTTKSSFCYLLSSLLPIFRPFKYVKGAILRLNLGAILWI